MFLSEQKNLNISDDIFVAESSLLSSVLLFYLNISLHCCVLCSHGLRALKAERGKNHLVMQCAPAVLCGWSSSQRSIASCHREGTALQLLSFVSRTERGSRAQARVVAQSCPYLPLPLFTVCWKRHLRTQGFLVAGFNESKQLFLRMW